MKLFNKLFTLVKSLARAGEARVSPPEELPEVQATQDLPAIEHEPDLEQGRVSDLLQRRLDASSRPKEKGD